MKIYMWTSMPSDVLHRPVDPHCFLWTYRTAGCKHFLINSEMPGDDPGQTAHLGGLIIFNWAHMFRSIFHASSLIHKC